MDLRQNSSETLTDLIAQVKNVINEDGLTVEHPDGPIAIMFLTSLGVQIMSASGFRKYDKELLEIRKRLHLFLDSGAAFNYAAKCDQRAFVGNSEQISEFFEFSNNQPNGYQMLLGKDKFLTTSTLWVFPYFTGTYVQECMGKLIDSGIYKMWEDVSHAKTRNQLDPSLKTTIENKQSLRSNLGSFFTIAVIFQFMAISIFLIELLYVNRYLLINTITIASVFRCISNWFMRLLVVFQSLYLSKMCELSIQWIYTHIYTKPNSNAF